MNKFTEPSYISPFTLTDEMTSLVIEIAETLGRMSVNDKDIPTPTLRKENRIKTIHSSLAIENNSLSLEQITAIIEGKRVLGPPNEILEVMNANEAYNILFELNPYKEEDLLKAHRLMMTDLVKENGIYRSNGVGVFDGQKCIHMAPPAIRIPYLMKELLSWVKKTKVHPLISSCVFHYEFEFIHPFADGNGRMGRMWQTLLLMQWKPIFAWIPVETIVKKHQQEYYSSIAQSDKVGNSTIFITFMLKCILDSLQEIEESNQKSNQKSNRKLLDAVSKNPNITIRELQDFLGMSESGVKKIIRKHKEAGTLVRVGGAKGGHWKIMIN